MISSGDRETVYRSVEEVPARLRTKLMRSTNGANSATILIADRRGRQEIAKAMRNLPGPMRRRLRQSASSSETEPSLLPWLTPARRAAVVFVLGFLALALIAVVFTHRWQ